MMKSPHNVFNTDISCTDKIMKIGEREATRKDNLLKLKKQAGKRKGRTGRGAMKLRNGMLY